MKKLLMYALTATSAVVFSAGVLVGQINVEGVDTGGPAVLLLLASLVFAGLAYWMWMMENQ